MRGAVGDVARMYGYGLLPAWPSSRRPHCVMRSPPLPFQTRLHHTHAHNTAHATTGHAQRPLQRLRDSNPIQPLEEVVPAGRHHPTSHLRRRPAGPTHGRGCHCRRRPRPQGLRSVPCRWVRWGCGGIHTPPGQPGPWGRPQRTHMSVACWMAGCGPASPSRVLERMRGASFAGGLPWRGEWTSRCLYVLGGGAREAGFVMDRPAVDVACRRPGREGGLPSYPMALGLLDMLTERTPTARRSS